MADLENESHVRIRLKGMSKKYDNSKALTELTGYRLIKDGEDYVVCDDDPKLRSPAPKFIVLGNSINILDTGAADRIVEELGKAPAIPQGIRFPSEIGIIGDLGFYSRLDGAVRPFFFSPLNKLGRVLQDSVFPFVLERKAGRALTVVPNIKDFYSRVAITKLAFLVGKFGIDEAEKSAFGKKAFADVLPNPFEPQEIFDALLTFPPYLVAWSFHRPNCKVVFVGNKIEQFDYRLFRTLPDFLSVDSSYFQASGLRASFDKVSSIRDTTNFVEVVVDAANKYWDFFTRPLQWLDEKGLYDELRAIKAMSLGRLLVADVIAIQRSSSSFARNRMMFEFFDKFAQLCAERAGVKKDRKNTESKWASYLVQDAMLEIVCRIFRYHGKNKRLKIYLALASFSSEIRTSIQRDLVEMHRKANVPFSSESVAECIRLIRNLAHGTFLSGGRFEKQFLKISPALPVDAQRLPWLYLFAFALDPEFFLREFIRALDTVAL